MNIFEVVVHHHTWAQHLLEWW